MHCSKCKGYYTPTDAEAKAIVEARVTLGILETFERQGGELTPAMRRRAQKLRTMWMLCPGCWLERKAKQLLWLVLGVLAVGAALCSSGCAHLAGRAGADGPGPASDGEQAEIERIRRERGAAKMSQREAEHALQRMIGSR